MKLGDFWPSRKPTTATGSRAVTPSDSADIVAGETALGLYVTGAGDVSFVCPDGTSDTWTVPANFILPVPVTRVRATGTTATGIKAIM